jgi:hypothetical protein
MAAHVLLMISSSRSPSIGAKDRRRASHDQQQQQDNDCQDGDDDDPVILTSGADVPVIAGAVQVRGGSVHVTMAVVAAVVVRTLQATDFTGKQGVRRQVGEAVLALAGKDCPTVRRLWPETERGVSRGAEVEVREETGIDVRLDLHDRQVKLRALREVGSVQLVDRDADLFDENEGQTRLTSHDLLEERVRDVDQGLSLDAVPGVREWVTAAAAAAGLEGQDPHVLHTLGQTVGRMDDGSEGELCQFLHPDEGRSRRSEQLTDEGQGRESDQQSDPALQLTHWLVSRSPDERSSTAARRVRHPRLLDAPLVQVQVTVY